MKRSSVQPFRQVTFWMTLVCLVVVAALVVACGDSGSAASSSSGSAKMVTITITEQTGGHDIYNFDPQTITIKAGTTIRWVNNSDENHLLASVPAGVFSGSSIVPRSGSNDNTYQLGFTQSGTYTISSTLVQREGNQPEGVSSSASATITVTT